jgi:hypothetical protein
MLFETPGTEEPDEGIGTEEGDDDDGQEGGGGDEESA